MQKIKAFFQRMPIGLWWFLGFLLLCGAYEYGRMLHLRPLPHHLWRQTTCLSLAHGYYTDEWNLFKPGVQSLIADHMSTGKSAGEFPLLYYAVGLIWKITGPSEFVYRALMLTIHAWGSWALCRLVLRLTGDRFWSILTSLLFFTIPAVVYFAIGFLTDVPALDLVLIGCLAYLRFFDSGSKRQLALGAGAVALGTLLKLTAAMLPMAIGGVCLATFVLPRWFALPDLMRQRTRRVATTIAAGLGLCAIWVGYTFYYNNLHGAEYSYQGTWALWDLTPEEARKAWTFGREIMVNQFFSIPAYVLLAFTGLYLAWNLRTLPRTIIALLFATSAGVLLYGLLWFIALDNHDYYFIEPLVLPIAVVVVALWHMRTHYPTRLGSPWLKGVALLVFAYQVLFAMNNLRMRQSDFAMAELLGTNKAELNHWALTRYWDMEGLLDIEPIARAHGIKYDDLIVIAPDLSVCQALYLCGQSGFNEFGGLNLHCPDLVDRSERGAKYFYLIGMKKDLRDRFSDCLGAPLFVHEEVAVYDIRNLANR